VSSFLTAHQHIIGSSVPQMVDSKRTRLDYKLIDRVRYNTIVVNTFRNTISDIFKLANRALCIFPKAKYIVSLSMLKNFPN